MIILSVLLAGCGEFVERLNPFDKEDDPELPPGDSSVEPQQPAPGAGFPFADDQVFELELTLPPASADALVYEGDYVPATLAFAGYEAETGVRLKGAGTFENLDGKPSLKLNFGAFTPGAKFLGNERLTLNAMKYDRTKMREAVAYRMYERMGVPSPRHGYAHLTINGENYGLYSIVETLDENFLDRAYPDDGNGNLYDSTFIYADLTGAGLVNFDLQEGEPAASHTDLQALVGALDAGNFWDVFQTRFDVDATLSFLAVDLASPNWDGYSRNTNNFLVYHATVADRWSIVPWGQDSAFYGGGLLYGGVRARITVACQNDVSCRAALEERISEVLAVWEGEDLHGWAAVTADLIDPTCQADPRKQEDCQQEDMLDLLLERPEEVRRELGP
ncbi:MAG: CotH kinase family protein [Pseudomonadota bacterium]|nr:CotH kinase family protein [Pseudomonadota bacterium]